MEENILTKDEQQTVDSLVRKLLEKLEVQADITMSEQNEMLEVLLETEDSGIIIGYHGEVLEALQLVLTLMITKKLGRFVRVSVEIGDYKKNRSAYLEKLASQMKERVLDDNREQTVSNLKPWERRVIHVLLQDDEDVTTESVGEGRDRVIVIKPKA